MIIPAEHRRAMSELADLYFAEQCARLGPIKGGAAPVRIRPAPALSPRPARRTSLDRCKL